MSFIESSSVGSFTHSSFSTNIFSVCSQGAHADLTPVSYPPATRTLCSIELISARVAFWLGRIFELDSSFNAPLSIAFATHSLAQAGT